jgi:hypothetical protein
VGPRAGLDNVETRKFLNVPGLELRSLGRPVAIPIRYPGWMSVCVYSVFVLSRVVSGLDVEKRKFLILPVFELRSLCGPARSQSL